MNLEEYIKDTLEIPYIEDGDTVVDGCFALNPYSASALFGDGKAKETRTRYVLELFYGSKTEIVKKAMYLYEKLQENKVTCQMPDYEHYRDIRMWKATINLTGGRDE